MKSSVLVLFFIMLMHGFVPAQSPWTRDKAGFYLQASWQTIPSYGTVFDQASENRRRLLERRISSNSFHFLAEYGFSHKTLFWVEAPFRFVQSGAPTSAVPPALPAGSLHGLGNITFACRQNFISGKLTFSGQFRVDLPATGLDSSTGLSTGFDALSANALLSLGQRDSKWYWFCYAGPGIRGKFGNSAVWGGGEAALKIRRHWLAVFSDVSWNTGSDTYSVPPANEKTALFLPRQGFWNAGAKGMIAFGRFFGSVISVSVPVDGDLNARQPAYTAGVYFRWD